MTLSARALCTIGSSTDGLKYHLGITDSSEDDRLERLVETATRAILRYCGVPNTGFHYEEARVDDIRGYGSVLMHVPKTPLLGIDSIVYDPQGTATTVNSDDYLIDNAEQGRVYRSGGWVWTASRAQWMTSFALPGTEESLYRVTYDCGWKTRNQVDNLGETGPMTLPEDLEEACSMLAAMMYRWAPRNPSIASERLLGWNASYVTNRLIAQGMPNEVASILDHYRVSVWA